MPLGGPEFCMEDLQSHYTFGINVSPIVTATLCGVPAPTVYWRFHDGARTLATREEITNYTFKYLIRLPKMNLKLCGRDLMLRATGNTIIVTKRQVFLTKCK